MRKQPPDAYPEAICQIAKTFFSVSCKMSRYKNLVQAVITLCTVLLSVLQVVLDWQPLFFLLEH